MYALLIYTGVVGIITRQADRAVGPSIADARPLDLRLYMYEGGWIDGKDTQGMVLDIEKGIKTIAIACPKSGIA